MEIINAKEAHERTLKAIPEDIELIASLVFKDIETEINKNNYSITYCRKYVDNWFFEKLNTIRVSEFFKKLGYNWSYNYGDWNYDDDSITISW